MKCFKRDKFKLRKIIYEIYSYLTYVIKVHEKKNGYSTFD